MKRNAILYFLFALVFTSSSFAIQKNSGDYDKKLGSKTGGIEKIKTTDKAEKQEMLQGYNKPARVDTKGKWDLNINVSFLYRYAVEKGLEIADFTSRRIPPDGSLIINEQIIKMDYDYHPAFKIGAGLGSTFDDWDINFYYTRYHSTDSKSEATDPDLAWITDYQYLQPVWVMIFLLAPTEIRGHYAKGQWKLKTDILDFELGRCAYAGKKISIHPYICLRSGRIDQKYYNEFIGTSTSGLEYTIKANNKSDSWIIGPRGGFDTNWCLGKGFSLIGNASGTIFYQKFTTKIDQDLLRVEQSYYHSTYSAKVKDRFINTNLEALLGLKWGKYFYNKRIHWDLLLGYDFEIYYNQNMIRSVWNSIQTTSLTAFTEAGHAHDDGNPNNLMFHGLVLSTKLDF